MITLPVSQLQFVDGGNTLWIQGPDGSTTLRIKTIGKFQVERCNDSPTSHGDMMVAGDFTVCVGKDADADFGEG